MDLFISIYSELPAPISRSLARGSTAVDPVQIRSFGVDDSSIVHGVQSADGVEPKETIWHLYETFISQQSVNCAQLHGRQSASLSVDNERRCCIGVEPAIGRSKLPLGGHVMWKLLERI